MTHRQPSPTLVILLSGPSSSGKTSLAKALQQRLPVPAVLLEADRAFPDVPHTHPGWESAASDPGAVVLALDESVAAWARAGFHVILDGSLPYEDRDLRDTCTSVFAPYDLRLVGVTCADPELTARERTRPEARPVGWAVRQARDIHDGMRYAALVDTSVRSSQECAEDVLAQLGLDTEPSTSTSPHRYPVQSGPRPSGSDHDPLQRSPRQPPDGLRRWRRRPRPE